jgi:hypothetical protein
MQYSETYTSEFTNPIILESSTCVAANNKEIMRQATILIKLIKILQTYGKPQSRYDKLVERIARKLQNHLDIWGLYRRKDKEELIASSLELEKILEDREILMIRKKVGDIYDEEYSLKIAAANWSIENLKIKKNQLENSIKDMSRLHSQLKSEDIEDINWIVQNNYQTIRDLGLGTEISEMIVKNMTTIAETIN